MRKKAVLLVVLTVCALLLLSGCKQNVGTPEDNPVVEEPEEEDEQVIRDRLYGFACGDMSDPFFGVLKDSVAAALAEQGDRIVVRDAAKNADTQAAQLREMIDMDVDAVFLCPVDPDSLTLPLQRLKEAGIPVICLDTRVTDSELTDAFIGSDDYNAGKVCGEDLTGKRPDGGYVVIVEDSKSASANERITGFEESITDPGFEIVKRIDTQGDDSVAGTELSALLAGDTQVDAVMCGDDGMAQAALTALEESGKSGILIYSVGGSPAVKSALAAPESPMTGVGAQSPINMGKTAVETAAAVLDDGVYEQETYVETFFIGKDNVDMYGTDGWQ